jgi:hypothetical protein
MGSWNFSHVVFIYGNCHIAVYLERVVLPIALECHMQLFVCYYFFQKIIAFKKTNL